MAYRDMSISQWLASGNPVVQAIVVMDRAADTRHAPLWYDRGTVGEYHWPEGYLDFDATTARILLWTVWNAILGLLFLYLANGRLRRKVA